MYVIDIETRAIEAHGPLLPEPVGLAIKYPNGDSYYYAWGHPTGNNAARSDVAGILARAWDKEWLTHNGCAFDVPVLEHYFGFPQRPWHLTHDTLFLSFLNNPHARSLSLKDLADEHCGMPPTEQLDLQDWILENTPCKSRKRAGAYIADAPAELVAPYAIGDVERTWALWQSLRDRVLPDMQQPYDRERRLAPILVGVQNTGLRVDMERLAVATAQYEETLEQLDQSVRTQLNAPGLSLDSDADLILALQANGVGGFNKTATGKFSAAKDSLDAALAQNPGLRKLLSIRSTIATYLSTFMRPWLDQAANYGGRLHAAYNQVRNPDGYGTRTGRLSSCLPAWETVVCDRGDVAVSGLRIGDLVLTHCGRFRPVKNIHFSGTKKIYKITLASGASVTCTSDHRLFTTHGWLSLEDINERMPETDTGRTIRNAGIEPGNVRGTPNRERYCHYCGGQIPHYFVDTEQHTATRPENETEASCLLQIENRNAEPYEREVPGTTPQLQRCHFGRQGVPDAASTTVVQGEQAVRIPACSCNAGGTWYVESTAGLHSTSCGRGQDEQRHIEPGIAYYRGPRSPTPGVAHIERIDFVGVERVFDLEVEQDHSFVAGRVFVHNSAPNLQNVPRDSDEYVSIRSFLLPEPGHVWVTGDFKSQEPRIAAHFEDGDLLQAYKDEPELDQYLWIAEMAKVSRKQAKVIFLALLYGMGLDKLAAQLGVPRTEAEMIRNSVRAALPGIVALNREVQDRFKRGLHIRTLGGRVYHCEPPKNGMTFEYKALNVLVQGSAADQGKEAVIYIADRLLPGERILGMVHDEISVSCPPERVEAVQQLMREAACALPCDAPMLMDCGHGNNWSEAK